MIAAKLPAQTEKAFQAQVVALARTLGYSCYHTFDSRHSAAGFPDLAVWRPGRFILAELKTDAGKLTPPQAGTIMELDAAGVEAYVWRPRDWAGIVEILQGAVSQ